MIVVKARRPNKMTDIWSEIALAMAAFALVLSLFIVTVIIVAAPNQIINTYTRPHTIAANAGGSGRKTIAMTTPTTTTTTVIRAASQTPGTLTIIWLLMTAAAATRPQSLGARSAYWARWLVLLSTRPIARVMAHQCADGIGCVPTLSSLKIRLDYDNNNDNIDNSTINTNNKSNINNNCDNNGDYATTANVTISQPITAPIIAAHCPYFVASSTRTTTTSTPSTVTASTFNAFSGQIGSQRIKLSHCYKVRTCPVNAATCNSYTQVQHRAAGHFVLLLFVLAATMCVINLPAVSAVTVSSSSVSASSGNPNPNALKYSTNVIRTKYGPVRGIVMRAQPRVETFLGVPYATPPVGSLR